jgi:hypothetical protein
MTRANGMSNVRWNSSIAGLVQFANRIILCDSIWGLHAGKEWEKKRERNVVVRRLWSLGRIAIVEKQTRGTMRNMQS